MNCQILKTRSTYHKDKKMSHEDGSGNASLFNYKHFLFANSVNLSNIME